MASADSTASATRKPSLEVASTTSEDLLADREYSACLCCLFTVSNSGLVQGLGSRVEYWLMAVIVGLRFLLSLYQLRASAARRAAWRGRGQRQRRSPALVGVVTRTARPRYSIEARQFFGEINDRPTASLFVAVVPMS